MNRKGFINIFMVIGIVAMIGIVDDFIFMKKSEPPPYRQITTTSSERNNDLVEASVSLLKGEDANFQVYNKFEVSFQYPNNWIIKDSSNQSGLNLFAQEKKYENDSLNHLGLTIADATKIDITGAKNKRYFDIKDMHDTAWITNVISIYFTEGTKTYLSTCTADVDVCNEIIETFRSTK